MVRKLSGSSVFISTMLCRTARQWHGEGHEMWTNPTYGRRQTQPSQASHRRLHCLLVDHFNVRHRRTARMKRTHAEAEAWKTDGTGSFGSSRDNLKSDLLDGTDPDQHKWATHRDFKRIAVLGWRTTKYSTSRRPTRRRTFLIACATFFDGDGIEQSTRPTGPFGRFRDRTRRRGSQRVHVVYRRAK
jgi:hypothetical protein